MYNSDFSKIQSTQAYMAGMRPVLNKRALFSDMSSEFVCPPDPNPYSIVTIKFRAAKNNIDKVYFVCKNEKHLMMKYKSDELFDWYEYDLELDDEKVAYYFEVTAGKITCVYDFRGVAKNVEDYYKFVIVPGNRKNR